MSLAWWNAVRAVLPWLAVLLGSAIWRRKTRMPGMQGRPRKR